MTAAGGTFRAGGSLQGITPTHAEGRIATATPSHNRPTRILRRHVRRFLTTVLPLPLAACNTGIQSALDPAGEEAVQIATLFWVMTAGGLAIWAFVVALSLHASRWKRRPISEDNAGRLILLGGVVFPVAVLTALLSYALWLMPSLRPFAGGKQAGLRIEVAGSQFWWHVVYDRPGGQPVASANEIRLPVGERVEFQLTSRDMIHSFWIPALGGKMDLIPGRTNRLSLMATRAGTYRGQCAEFCGTSHALMAFPVVAMEPTAFDAWLDERSRASTGVKATSVGRDVFLRERCGDCHRIDGTPAQGTAGPDLSHLGSRLTIGAGLLVNDAETLARFIAHPASLKPGAQMPAYLHLSDADLGAIAAWLKGLQ
ncbi:cytochrome c oxidase subunit II [Mesorhizobium sp. J428]|uniref:cytochrome c oxidase subunit II n=1 Tax=Mesorhizobium sp. J428 TaxID=2898440 RepID=UPI002151D3DE|nr:cytochrome c oxidase subunit II [Mesorhizobium sp. J428]MCR5858618.1 cytochrome c oxidase subunit II [Mesorhizobium sp. J428]